MTDLTKILDEFKKLSLEDKKGKLMNIFEQIKTRSDVFPKLIEAIKLWRWIDEDFCNQAYDITIELLEKVDEVVKKRLENKLGSMVDYIHKLHQKEEVERSSENPDALLDMI